VRDGAVVDHDHKLSKLVERLPKKYPENHNEIAAEYVTEEIELVL
jgi:hypothetical protein